MSPVLIWFICGIAFFVTELILPGFIVFFFGLGAWCTALVQYAYPLPLSGQLMVFLGASLVTLLLLRAWLRSVFLGSSRREEDSVTVEPDRGTGTIVEDIVPPASGRVKYGGTFWRAEADRPIASGTVVRIVAQKDLLVQVEPMEEEKS
jgi:membrane protein implicated in regulation of membrane protease activity